MKNRIGEKEFEQLYLKEKPMYEAWGNYLKTYILSKLKEKYMDLDKILKLPVSCRTKELTSLIAKAFYRNKNYTDPYADITDKVGIRFVVMRESDITKIGKIIEECESWLDFSKDQDFNAFRKLHPEVFTYQSQHYVVRNRIPITTKEVTIIEGTPCEIQIRTIEQHVYAEVSHDLFYKKDEQNDTVSLRLLARMAAFNEESDELVERMYKMKESKEEYYNTLMQALKSEYGFTLENDKLNRTIYDDIEGLIKKYNINIESIRKYTNERPYILALINTESDTLSQQPVILIVYFLLENYRHEFEANWSFTEDTLDSIKANLGIAME